MFFYLGKRVWFFDVWNFCIYIFYYYYIKIDMDVFVNLDIKYFGGYCKNVWFVLR